MKKQWPMVKLGEVLIERKERVGSFDAGDLTLLGVSNQDGIHSSGMPRITDMSRYLRVESDWFAYNPMRINVGSIGWAQMTEQTGVISPDYVVFSCSEQILPRLLFSFLKHRRGLQEINKATAGSVRERLYFDKLAQIEIPLPPLTEQKRIVARIEELAAQVEEARALRRQSTEGTVALLAAFRRAAFGESPQSSWVPLSNYVSNIVSGKSPATEGRRATPDEWAVLKVGAVSFGVFDDQANKALPVSYAVPPALEVRVGDFIMSRANTAELVGACAMVRKTRPKLMLSDKTFRFVFREPRMVVAEYLEQALKSPALREQIERGASGTSTTMKNISKEKVLALRLPPFSLSEQRRILSESDALQTQVDALKRLLTETADELDALLPSILDRAFSGQL